MSDTDSDLAAARELQRVAIDIRRAVGTVVIGQDAVVEQMIVALLCRGHCLLQGVPGLAKTLLVRTLAAAAGLRTRRVQFTPDLMPSDITGTDILQDDPATGRRKFEFQPGPIFTNLLVADEINRAPPKTQAALLEAMQERQVSAGGATLTLPDPFVVMATQNPIEQEGTYPLPEAQLDRFMFMTLVPYPSEADELAVLDRDDDAGRMPDAVVSPDELKRFAAVTKKVPASDDIRRFVLGLVRASRPDQPGASDFVRQWLAWGAGPRAGQHLLHSARARALMHGRLHVTFADIDALAPAVLRHRLIPNFSASAEQITPDQIVERLLTLVPRGKERRLL